MSETTDSHRDRDDNEWTVSEIDEDRSSPLNGLLEADVEEDVAPFWKNDAAATASAITAFTDVFVATEKLSGWRPSYSFWSPNGAAVVYASPDEATFVHIGTQRLGPEPYDWPIEFRIDTNMLGRRSRTKDILAAVDAQADLRTGIVQALQTYSTSQVLTAASGDAQSSVSSTAHDLEQ